MHSEWLVAKGARPLYNPQIAQIDPSRREKLVEKFLREDFAGVISLGDLGDDETFGPANDTPLQEENFLLHRSHFDLFIEKYIFIFERYVLKRMEKSSETREENSNGPGKTEGSDRTGEAKEIKTPPLEKEKRAKENIGNDVSKPKRSIEKKGKTVGRVKEVQSEIIRGWIDFSLLDDAVEYRLVLKVDGEVLKRRKLKRRSTRNKEQKNRIPFRFQKLQLKKGEHLELFLQPGHLTVEIPERNIKL
jgi:hypothetical protein